MVSGGALSVNDFNTASFSVAPNPSNSVWNVRSAQYELFQLEAGCRPAFAPHPIADKG